VQKNDHFELLQISNNPVEILPVLSISSANLSFRFHMKLLSKK